MFLFVLVVTIIQILASGIAVSDGKGIPFVINAAMAVWGLVLLLNG